MVMVQGRDEDGLSTERTIGELPLEGDVFVTVMDSSVVSKIDDS